MPASENERDVSLVHDAIARRDWRYARVVCERLLQTFPADPEALHALGIICWAEDQLDEAVGHISAALLSRPCSVWLNNLGVLYSAMGRPSEAVDAFRRTIELDPGTQHGWLHLALALRASGEDGEALEILRKVVGLQPCNVKALAALGRLYLDGGDLPHAYDLLARAVALCPESAEAHTDLADVCLSLLKFDGAHTHALRAAELAPTSHSFARLAITAWHAGDWATSRRARGSALLRGIEDPQLHSALIANTLFDPEETAASQYASHRRWALIHCTLRRDQSAWANRRDPDRRLKIGFVAAELFSSPARRFRLPLLRSLDSESFEVYVYNLSPDAPEPGYFQGIIRTLPRRSDENAADLIRSDSIDVLVDCSGHQSYGRLRIFGFRPAPVQVVWSGYAATSGLQCMDAFFTDSVLSPVGTEIEYSEPLVRLSGGRFLFEPPSGTPPVTALPAVLDGFITFGFFGSGAKLSPAFAELAATIMARVPHSRMLIHHADPAYDDLSSSAIDRIRAAFAAHGISADRLSFIGPRSAYEHLNAVAEADIALDSFPFNGHAITCDCLWMGVPVVSRRGATHAGRVSTSLLAQLGLSEFAVASDEEYVSTAVTLSKNLQKLSEVRAGLRAKIAVSALTDIPARTREFESECRKLWRAWCSSAPPRTNKL